MAFWLGILALVALTVGAAVVVGLSLDKRNQRRRISRKEALALRVSGAFPQRKEND